MGKILFTREKANEGAAKLARVISNRPLKHRIGKLKRIENRPLRYRPIKRNLHFAGSAG